jgi:uncharacterized membrane protein YedE/YeeE
VKKAIGAFLAGLVFAIGLGISGMTQPSKVIGFLDFAGDWDPSLAFVMVGAIGVHFVLMRVIKKRRAPIAADVFRIPTREDLSPALIGGSAMFGVGWGLGGYCPGPAIVSLASHSSNVLVFVAAMLAGIFIHRLLTPKKTRVAASECAP